jgi:hypothetical protein
MSIPAPKRQVRGIARLLTVAAMLLLYLIGSTQSGYLHQLLHPQETAATHSTKQELDPCHRAMYHGVDSGCRHEFHLVKKHSCTFIHTLTHSDPALFDTCHGFSISIGRVLVLLSDSARPIIVTYTFLTRGPPVGLLV